MLNLTKTRGILSSILLSSSIIMTGLGDPNKVETEMVTIDSPAFNVSSNVLMDEIIIPEIEKPVNRIEGIQYLELTELSFAVNDYKDPMNFKSTHGAGTVVAVQANLSNGWYELLDGGYIREEFTKVREDLGNRIYVKVTADSLNKRISPTPRSKYMGALIKGDLHSVTKVHDTGWLQLADGTYVNGKYTQRLDVDKNTFYSMVETRKKEAKAKAEAALKAKQEAERKANEEAAQKATLEKVEKAKEIPSVSQGSGNYSSINLTNSQRDLLARLIYCEANVEPFEGQVGVAQVIFNRMLDKRFPDTIEGVINASGQFVPVSTGKINRVTPTAENYKAIDTALSSGHLNGAVYFHNPKYSGGSWWNSLTTVASIGSHSFKK